jgi:GAF domain-containing protein
MAPNRRADQEHQLALSDEAAAYIADALMQLALEFENNHYAQIRRHHQAIAPEPDDDPRQFDFFRKPSPFHPN